MQTADRTLHNFRQPRKNDVIHLIPYIRQVIDLPAASTAPSGVRCRIPCFEYLRTGQRDDIHLRCQSCRVYYCRHIIVNDFHGKLFAISTISQLLDMLVIVKLQNYINNLHISTTYQG